MKMSKNFNFKYKKWIQDLCFVQDLVCVLKYFRTDENGSRRAGKNGSNHDHENGHGRAI